MLSKAERRLFWYLIGPTMAASLGVVWALDRMDARPPVQPLPVGLSAAEVAEAVGRLPASTPTNVISIRTSGWDGRLVFDVVR